MTILYLGPLWGTALQRAGALARAGFDVEHVSPHAELPKHWAAWLFHGGGFGLDTLAARSIEHRLAGRTFDMAIVDSGDVVGPKTMSVLRRHTPRIANYNPDNPYVIPSPEKLRWRIMARVMDQYDLAVAIRRPGLAEQMRIRGVRNPMLIWQTADELVHKAPTYVEDRWKSDVVFVGNWMPGRDDFMAELLAFGLRVSIYGPRWKRAPRFAELKSAVHSQFLEGTDYTSAIAGAKIAIVILNNDNYDLHTKRSVEIPAIGTLMCAIDTEYHQLLYKENEEAIFFKSAQECALKCLDLLKDEDRRSRIAAAGHARTFKNRTYNELLMREIVERTLAT